MDENNKKVKSKNPLVIAIIVVAVLAIGASIAFLFMKKPEVVEKIMKPITKSIYEAKSVDLGQPNDDVGVMILSCDTTDDLSDARNIAVTNRVDRYVEGTGAFTNSSFDVVIGQGVFRKMIDISEYKSVHISIYVNDVSKLQDSIWFELTQDTQCLEIGCKGGGYVVMLDDTTEA